MVKQLSILILSLFLIASSAIAGNDTELINAFYQSYNTKNYKSLDTLISDNIVLIVRDQKALETKSAFIDIVKWGEVFNSKLEKNGIKEENGFILVDEIQDSERIQFYYGQTIQTKTTFSINDGKISKIEIDLLDLNEEEMMAKREKFLSWIKVNRPRYFPTINHLNRQGAKTLKKGMKLYNKKKK